MICSDDQTVSSRTESRGVQFQGAVRSVSLNCSKKSDVMEANEKINQPEQRCSPKCGKNATEKVDIISAFKEELSATKSVIFELQKRNAVLEEVVVNLCDQMQHITDRLPASSEDEQATMQAALKNSLAKLSDIGRLQSGVPCVNGPSKLEGSDEIILEEICSIESPTNSNLTLKNTEIYTTLQANQFGEGVLNGETSTVNVQDNCDIPQEVVQENCIDESDKEPFNGNVENVKDSQPLVYHLSEKHGQSGSKTLRINIAPSREQNHPQQNRLTRSSFSSSFSTLPNVTSAKVDRKSKSKYERTNSLQSLNASASLDDLDWPDTDKLLEELEVIKEKSLSNLAMDSKQPRKNPEKSKAIEGESDSFKQPQLQGCPDGSGHCDTGGDSKSSLSENQPPQLGENIEVHCELRKRNSTNDLIGKSVGQVTTSRLSNNKETSDICDGPLGCTLANDDGAAECGEEPLPNNVTSVLQCASESLQSTSKLETSQEDVPKSNSKAAANNPKSGKASSKKRRRKRLSESESASKSGDEAKDLVSETIVNEFCKSVIKPDHTQPRSDVPITTSRRKSKNKHTSSNTSSANAGGDNRTPHESTKKDASVNMTSLSSESPAVNSMEERMPSVTEEFIRTSPTPHEISNMEARSHLSSPTSVANNIPLTTDVSDHVTLLTEVIFDPSSVVSVVTEETSTEGLSSSVLSKPEDSSDPSATDVNVIETISPSSDKTTSGPSLTEVACAASESRVEDAKCSKVSDTCQLSRSESPGLDQHTGGTSSHFSPEAKEFEPTREYGKAKLLLSPEVSKDARSKTRCPKLTSTSMEQDNYSPPSEEKQGSCAECGTSTSQRCSNCRQVFYCKRECQREHWKKGHKTDCKPFKLEKNSTLGRYLVATRDFKAGDIIFKDEPLFIGPKQITEPICLGCYKRVDGSYRCSKCTWPMCGPVCESSPDHQPECVVGKVMGSPIEIPDFNDTNHFYEVVSPLRGLALKKKAPKKYEELLSLESHFNDRVGTHVYNENQKRVVNMLKNYFMLVDFPPEDIDASDRVIHLMTGIIDVNTVEIPLEETEIIGIYPTYSMLEHSCTPNTKYKISPLNQLTLRAAVNIRQGEHLSTIYTHMLWGTAGRRDCLKSTRYFMCTCRRCADPTELGTNFSALRCPKCPLGFMMSAAPLDQLADWICTSCNSTMTADEANDITLQLGEEVETVLANARVKDLEDFIEKSSATIVHPNHFHLFAARHSLLQMLGREKPGLDEEAVRKKEKLCQEFLKTCTALDPGMCKLSSYAGVALYEYHLAVMARTRQGPTDQQVDKIALKKDLDTAKALLQQCIKVLQEEPLEKPEGQLRMLAEQNLQELSQWESP